MCHIFKDRYNISINTFKTKKRLEKSMRLLLQTDKKISDIASLCGFNNTSYFTEIFTKNVGISPSLFRTKYPDIYIHDSYNYDDFIMATKLGCVRFTENGVTQIPSYYKYVSIHVPDDTFKFLHEAAIIEYKGCLYAS
ncbi:MAG: helix-turn-helix transcriptional regulator [Clostridia bacterium]|nr:helix-turn-helix transcriptional regulator [Clostridia bacterium]